MFLNGLRLTTTGGVYGTGKMVLFAFCLLQLPQEVHGLGDRHLSGKPSQNLDIDDARHGAMTNPQDYINKIERDFLQPCSPAPKSGDRTKISTDPSTNPRR